MRDHTPIACTLEPAQMRDRAASIDALLADALLDRRPIDGGVRITFRDAPDVERRVHDLIAAESHCCAFLTFAVGRERDAFRVDITGAPEARPVIDRFFAAA
jgi:MerR family transcriptional regulator, copper efflux regulator